MSRQSPFLSGVDRDRCGLPVREFMYTLDQVAHLLGVDVRTLTQHVRFLQLGRRQARSEHKRSTDKRMRAIRLMPTPDHDHREWRVPERELIRYLRAHNLVVYERKYRT